jgi:very-short-patch-repair endonuclease
LPGLRGVRADDRRHEVFLKTEGYQIVRVQNDDASKHINDLLDMILVDLEGRL